MEQQVLQSLVSRGLSSYKIADALDLSQTATRYWLKKYGLSTVNKNKAFLCKCGETDPEKFVNLGGGRKHHYKCKACHSQYTIERFRMTKTLAVEYKGGKCILCSYNKCLGSLHFHHRNPKKKDPNWNRMRTWKFDKITKELDKCDLVCANCHGEIHEPNILRKAAGVLSAESAIFTRSRQQESQH